MQYVILFLYFAILFGIGIVASRRVQNLEDYYVGGKRLGFWVVAFSARATGESAWLLLGLTGLGAMVGVSAFWVVVGEVLGVAVSWYFMAGRFKRETDAFQSITIPDYLVSKFTPGTGRQAFWVRTIAAGTLAIFIAIYVSAQIDATGRAFEQFLSWNYYAGILAGFGIVVAYTFFGGFVAVAWSDVFQGLIMMLGLVCAPIFAAIALPSGLSLPDTLRAIDPALMNVWGPGGFTVDNGFILVSYLAIGLGFLGSPQVYVRFMAIESEDSIRRGRPVAILFTLLTDAGAVLTGILGRALLTESGADVEMILGSAAENVLPVLVDYLFPAFVVGLYSAAVLAAIMSTIDSLLVVASSAVTRDFHQQLFNPDIANDKLTRYSRVVTLALAVAALAIALFVSVVSPDRTVFWFVIFGWSGIAATFCPVIILSLFWQRYTVRGVLASMVTGFVSVPFFKFVVPTMGDAGASFALAGEMAPAFACAILAGIVASLTSKK